MLIGCSLCVVYYAVNQPQIPPRAGTANGQSGVYPTQINYNKASSVQFLMQLIISIQLRKMYIERGGKEKTSCLLG